MKRLVWMISLFALCAHTAEAKQEDPKKAGSISITAEETQNGVIKSKKISVLRFQELPNGKAYVFIEPEKSPAGWLVGVGDYRENISRLKKKYEGKSRKKTLLLLDRMTQGENVMIKKEDVTELLKLADSARTSENAIPNQNVAGSTGTEVIGSDQKSLSSQPPLQNARDSIQRSKVPKNTSSKTENAL